MKKPPPSLTPDQLTKLKQQISLHQETIAQLQASESAARQSLLQQRSEIQAETDQKLEEQQDRLDEQYKRDLARRGEAHDRIKEALDQRERLERELTTHEANLSGLQTEIDAAKQDLQNAQSAKLTAEADEQRAKNQTQNLLAQIRSLQAQPGPLAERITELKLELSGTEQDLEEVQRQAKQAQEAYDTQSLLLSQNITTLTGRRDQLALELAVATPELQEQRDEISREWRRLEAREKNLKVREFKVARGEQKLIRNSDLLSM